MLNIYTIFNTLEKTSEIFKYLLIAMFFILIITLIKLLMQLNDFSRKIENTSSKAMAVSNKVMKMQTDLYSSINTKRSIYDLQFESDIANETLGFVKNNQQSINKYSKVALALYARRKVKKSKK